MVNSGDPITYDAMKALADLANTKLAPVTPYAFPPFAGKDQIVSPVDIKPTPTYGSGSFPDGSKITLWLYPYKSIAGTRTYAWQPLVKAFYGKVGSGDYSIAWTWVNPTGATAPDGYIVVIPYPLNGGWQFIWQDIGLVATFSEDGSFSNPDWKFDTTLDQYNQGAPLQNLPCGHGAWLKPWNLIHSDLFNAMDLFGGSVIPFDPAFLLSGPWVVSVAQKCYLYLNSVSIYDSLKFLYSETDSLTGNEISPEADMLYSQQGLDSYTGGTDGTNSLDWSQNVIVNGRMILLSPPNGQPESDWALSASPGIATSFDANYFDPVNGFMTALIFDFDNVPYTVGTPLTITAIPSGGAHILNTGSPTGGGLSVNCVFTGDQTVYSALDATAIHYAGIAVKSVALPSSLPAITLTTAIGGSNVLEAHHRTFCDGVFTAKTLPTLGLMPYVDVDLPQYSPENNLATPSNRRVALNASLSYIPHVDNRGALWPVFKDSDFTPDSVAGQPFRGSKAFQALGVSYVSPRVVSKSIPPSGIANTLTLIDLVFVGDGITGQDLRFFASDPNVTLFAKAGSQPTFTSFDIMAVGGVWYSAAVSDPGYAKNIIWFVSIFNPTSANIKVNAYSVVIDDGTAPNGTFFPTVLDDSNAAVPQQEGFSYNFPNPTDNNLRPIPLSGYSIYSVTVRRKPVNNGFGILLAPDAGTTALNVDLGIMAGFSWSIAGTFQKLQTITIPAGQSEITVAVLLPVISGTPLAYQCSEEVMIRASVNFQPMMHSQFFPATTTKGGSPSYVIGNYNGKAWYDQNKAMLTFPDNNFQTPILLPVSSSVYNDLTSVLDLLP